MQTFNDLPGWLLLIGPGILALALAFTLYRLWRWHRNRDTFFVLFRSGDFRPGEIIHTGRSRLRVVSRTREGEVFRYRVRIITEEIFR
jgi:hypothetical protein